jgi:hypothetical protein
MSIKIIQSNPMFGRATKHCITLHLNKSKPDGKEIYSWLVKPI